MSRLDPLHLMFRRSRGRALSAYWDAVVLRAPSDPVPPADVDRELAATVRRLQAAPPHPRPAPAFADQLLDTVLQPRQGDRPMPITPSFPASLTLDQTRRSLPQRREPVVGLRPTAGHWAGLAVAGLVAAVVLASLWTASLDGGAPRDRRDTSALAAVGSPVASSQPAPAATPALNSANRSVTDGGNNNVFFTGVVDLSGPRDSAWLWVIPVVPKASVLPPAGAPYLVMPLTGDLHDRVSGAPLYAGQAFAPTGAQPWELANDTDVPVDVLFLTGSDAPPNVVAAVPTGYQTSPLGKLTFDPAQEAALLEVTRTIGPESTTVLDTGRGGIAIVRAEHSPTIVDIVAGEGALQRYTATGTQQPGYEPGFLPTDQGPATVYMADGDILTITGGAAAQIEGQGAGATPTLVVTLRFDSARLDSIQRGVIVIPANKNAAGTPIAPNGCGVGRYTAEELRGLVATPAAGPLPSLAFGLADGTPADVWTARDIQAAADRLATCFQTGDPLRYARLWTADGLRFVYSVLDLEEDLAREVVPDTSYGGMQPTVQDVRLHGDGRVSAVVDLDGEIAYVVWVKQGGVYLVELFNDAIFAGDLADGARCDAVPLDAEELAVVVPATLTPAPFHGDGGFDIYDPAPEGYTPVPVAPDAPGAADAIGAVGRIFDCLSTLDPARVAALATDGFRAQWLGVARGVTPLGEPSTTAATRFPLTVPTVFTVVPWKADGTSYLGVGINGQTLAYLVLKRVDGEWLIDGWSSL